MAVDLAEHLAERGLLEDAIRILVEAELLDEEWVDESSEEPGGET